MIGQFTSYIKDKSKINIESVLSDWNWILPKQLEVLYITLFGDIFFTDNEGGVNWLDTGSFNLNKVAESLEKFHRLLLDEENVNTWLLPHLCEELITSGQKLEQEQVYSFKLMPALGGEYVVDNIKPTDIYVHFSISGQIGEQIKDIPDGTRINFKLTE
uniref:T6SS immunity protein Tdi1 domain-containing protein n=1 Tax=Pedobacter schmidteae TaxID=2201271 RepID=UPI000EADAD14|nr:T6SS immunity protein Tdi1 domain-containing protein [Pedobacter schmidteae]